MSTLILHTDPLSPYGWTAALIATEKGVSYDLHPVDTTQPAHRRLHPFGKMPVLQHGEILVYETLAIAHYIDRAFAGPALQPVDHLAQTHVLRWISIVNSYIFPVMNGLIKERMAPVWRDTPVDEEALASFRAPLAEQLALIDETVSAHRFLAGDKLTLADAFLLPHLHYASLTPEGAEALAETPAALAWLEQMRGRPSFAATNPLERT